MKVYYVANARMPNEKAHGIQLAKMCEAFLAAGIDLTLVVPGRKNVKGDIKSFYKLEVSVPMQQLPVVDAYVLGPIGFFLSSFSFIASYVIFFIAKKVRGEKFVIYTIDMDNFSSFLLPHFGPTYTEMHSPKKASLYQRIFFSRARGAIAINSLVKDSLVKTFSVPPERVLVEQNGVDLAVFAPMSKDEARQNLVLPTDAKIALYIGRFYGWKGLEVLPGACEALEASGIDCYVVGGTREEFIKVSGISELPPNLHIISPQDNYKIPMWLAAADALLVLGTKLNEESYRYTSPMKVFEYMAAKRPIIASDTPALRAILSDDDALFYEPDYTASLARAIEKSLADTEGGVARVAHAYEKIQTYSWDMRAARIISFIKKTIA